MTRRSSLRDRNRAAIALDADTPAAPIESAAPPATEPTDVGEGPTGPAQPPPQPAAEAATPERPAPRRPAAATSAGDTARLGIYLTPSEFDQAKAGYLADWTNGGTCDTFARWIAAAIDTHAARTPRQRAAKAHPRGRAEERTGSTRSFSIAVDTMTRMRAAITADQHAGRWPSDSAWCGEAISLAVSAARDRNGGALPNPPPRLPNRLVR